MLIVVAVVLGIVLITAALVDLNDRRNGRKIKDAKLLGQHIKAARRERRSKTWGTGVIGRLQPKEQRGPYRQADGSRRPVKRGQ